MALIEGATMAITKRVIKTAGMTAGVIGILAASAPDNVVGRAARRLADRLGRDVRYTVASAPGLVYRLAGRSPDPSVTDDVLADRIRSSLGPLEKRLDVPRVHVIVEDHVAIVHGDVPDEGTAHAIERAVTRISGVKGVESHLHPGLVAGDTRHSQGAAVRRPASAALTALLESARDAGAGANPRAAVHAVLCGFTDRMPEHVRDRVLTMSRRMCVCSPVPYAATATPRLASRRCPSWSPRLSRRAASTPHTPNRSPVPSSPRCATS
jgi:hypothetical protein